MPTQKLTAEIIHAAIEGFESQKRRIDSQIDELRQLLNGASAESGAESGSPVRKRKISAAGRRRMAAAQKARWAKIRGEADGKPSSAQSPAPKAKRKLSAAGRKAISEATKRRWALKRAEAVKASAPTKKAPAKSSSSKPKKKARTAPQAAATSMAQWIHEDADKPHRNGRPTPRIAARVVVLGYRKGLVNRLAPGARTSLREIRVASHERS